MVCLCFVHFLAMKASMRKIIHVDMDAFYASVEQRDAPHLRGRPVAVGFHSTRGVVAAASYEARTFGVRSAMPSFQARQLCPDLIFVPARMSVYREISSTIRNIFYKYADLVEPLSLDEAYLDVSLDKSGLGTAVKTARAIRADIYHQTKLTASAGVSYNKFLAKMASGLNKPNGQTVITPDDGPTFVARLDVAQFHGIGPSTANKLLKLNVKTGEDLRACSKAFLSKHFGKAGLHYYHLSRGVDDRPVEPNRPRKSLGTERTFATNLKSWEDVHATTHSMCVRLQRDLQQRGLWARTLTLKVRYADFRQFTRSRSLQTPFQDYEPAASLLDVLLQEPIDIARGIRLLGLTMTALSHEHEIMQPTLDF